VARAAVEDMWRRGCPLGSSARQRQRVGLRNASQRPLLLPTRRVHVEERLSNIPPPSTSRHSRGLSQTSSLIMTELVSAECSSTWPRSTIETPRYLDYAKSTCIILYPSTGPAKLRNDHFEASSAALIASQLAFASPNSILVFGA
jgi:hypothetical protein